MGCVVLTEIFCEKMKKIAFLVINLLYGSIDVCGQAILKDTDGLYSVRQTSIIQLNKEPGVNIKFDKEARTAGGFIAAGGACLLGTAIYALAGDKQNKNYETIKMGGFAASGLFVTIGGLTLAKAGQD